MTTTVTREWARPPAVARLGFDDGWLILRPTFLNLQMPVIVVDQAFIGDPCRHGLEPFGTRDPNEPLPLTGLATVLLGLTVIIRERLTGELIANTCLRAERDAALLSTFDVAVVIVGSTYLLELTWAALWTMSIGRTTVLCPTSPQ